MKKRLNQLILLIILSISVVYLCGCNNNSKNNNEEVLKQKLSSEMLYLENELISMANELNNITYLNYSVVTSKKESGTTNENNKSSQNGEGSQQEGENTQQSKDGKTESTKKTDSEEENKVYTMVKNNLLERDETIDWKEQKNKAEKLYLTLPTIEADLKEANIPIEDIEKFNSSIDNITASIINENKEESLNNIIVSYSYIVEFIKKYEGESKNEKILNLKYLTLLCYKDVNNNDWDSLNENLNNLKLNYSNIKYNDDIFSGKEVNIKNGEVIIEELKNSVNSQNQDIFFIKYKTFMQELNLLNMD